MNTQGAKKGQRGGLGRDQKGAHGASGQGATAGGRRPLREGDYPLGISLDVSHTPKIGPDLR